MRPDQCGTGRPIESLPPGDREVVEDYRRFLEGELNYDPVTNEFCPPGTGIAAGRKHPKETT